MEICIKNKDCIITPLSKRLDERASSRLKAEITEHLLFNIGIDMSYVEDCTIDFIEAVRNKRVSLFNVSSEILTLFNIMGVDKCANLYIFENDFKNNANRMLKREFKIVRELT